MPTSSNFIHVLALVTLSCFQVPYAFCSTRSSAPFDMDDPLLWAPLIVRGEVVRVDRTSSTLGEWGAQSSSRIEIVVEDIHIRVLNVVKGSYAGAYLDVAAFSHLYGDDGPPYVVGNEVLLAVFYNMSTMRFHLRNYLGLFVRNDRAWVRPRDPTSDELNPFHRSMTLDEIEARVHTMSNDSIVDMSELIVAGELLAVESRGSAGSRQQCWTLEVTTVLKGEVSTNRVEFCMPNRGTLPEWAVPIPGKATVGETWVVSLRRQATSWIPFAGVNGMFKIEVDKLLYDGTVDTGLRWVEFRRLVEASQ